MYSITGIVPSLRKNPQKYIEKGKVTVKSNTGLTVEAFINVTLTVSNALLKAFLFFHNGDCQLLHANKTFPIFSLFMETLGI